LNRPTLDEIRLRVGYDDRDGTAAVADRRELLRLLDIAMRDAASRVLLIDRLTAKLNELRVRPRAKLRRA